MTGSRPIPAIIGLFQKHRQPNGESSSPVVCANAGYLPSARPLQYWVVRLPVCLLRRVIKRVRFGTNNIDHYLPCTGKPSQWMPESTSKRDGGFCSSVVGQLPFRSTPRRRPCRSSPMRCLPSFIFIRGEEILTLKVPSFVQAHQPVVK